MQEDKEIVIKMLQMLLQNRSLISLNTKIDVKSNLISVKFSTLIEDNALFEISNEIQKDISKINRNESDKDVLTSGFSKNEIEHLKEQYGVCGNQIRFGVSSSTEDQNRIR